MTGTDRLTDAEIFLASKVAERFDALGERAPLASGLVGAHRWGIDLEQDAGEQQFAHRSEAIEDAMGDLAAEGYLAVMGEVVVDRAEELLDELEDDLDGLDLNGRGGLVEKVNTEGSA